VVSYRSFGPATAEQNAFFGGLPPGSEAGELIFKMALFVGGVHVHDGFITIVCELGVPPKNLAESTLLLVPGTSYNVNEPVSGDNIVIRSQPRTVAGPGASSLIVGRQADAVDVLRPGQVTMRVWGW
jgi:hypothetical protein